MEEEQGREVGSQGGGRFLKADMKAALSDLRHYLRAWRNWLRGWRPNLGAPHQAPFVRLMKGVVSWSNPDDAYHENSDKVDENIMRTLDVVIEGLNQHHRCAVRYVWLREHNRLSAMQASRLCDEAEIDMVGLLRDRGVVLGGK